MTTLTVPMTDGNVMQIRGFDHGLFVVHQADNVIEVHEDMVRPWTATHKKSGVRFPYWFMFRAACEAFVDDVLPLMNWEAADAVHAEGKFRAVWTAAKPTEEQRIAVKKAAEARGGMKFRIT